MKTNRQPLRRITFQSKYLLLIPLLMCFGCRSETISNQNQESYSYSEISEMTTEERKIALFNNFEKSNQNYSIQLISEGLDTNDVVAMLCSSLFFLSIDSITKFNLYVNKFGQTDSTACTSEIVKELTQLSKESSLPKDYRKKYVLEYYKLMDVNNIDKLCEVQLDTTESTYQIQVEIPSE